MQNVNFEESISVLNEIVRYKLVAGKIHHFALMVTGPHRLILDKLRIKLPNLSPHAQQVMRNYRT